MPESIKNLFGNKVRVRACGICVVDNKLLMVNHKHLAENDFWAPPGGGIELYETAHQTLEREFLEETHIKIKPKDLLFVTEFCAEPLHAIELFFEVEWVEGAIRKGADPEMKSEQQIIVDVRFLSWEEIAQMEKNQLHGLFKYVAEPAKIIDLRGYFKL
ncbi:MAG TPA: NUDIX hydrolase [Cytophagales bacterium]|nr:NUDIX hydrolase [Cytophagales bacterium]